uniref:ARAD1D01672p n=1 Tax=Blastobotrys adeninivorans TaxID=409370 RepID=A0A060T885_BLAAD
MSAEFAENWRRRRACERCRRTKVRCEYESPIATSCIRCTKAGAVCETTTPNGEKAPQSSLSSRSSCSGPDRSGSSSDSPTSTASRIADLEATIVGARNELRKLRGETEAPSSTCEWADAVKVRNVVDSAVSVGLLTHADARILYDQFVDSATLCLPQCWKVPKSLDDAVNKHPILALAMITALACARGYQSSQSLVSFVESAILDRLYVVVDPSLELLQAIVVLILYVQPMPIRKMGIYLTTLISLTTLLDLGSDDDIATICQAANELHGGADLSSPFSTSSSDASSSPSTSTIPSSSSILGNTFDSMVGGSCSGRMNLQNGSGLLADDAEIGGRIECPSGANCAANNNNTQSAADSQAGGSNKMEGADSDGCQLPNRVKLARVRIQTLLSVYICVGSISVITNRQRLAAMVSGVASSATALLNSPNVDDKVLVYTVRQVLVTEEAVAAFAKLNVPNTPAISFKDLLDKYKKELDDLVALGEGLLLPSFKDPKHPLRNFVPLRSVNHQFLLVLNEMALNNVVVRSPETDNTLVFPIVQEITALCLYMINAFVDAADNAVILPKFAYVRSIHSLSALMRLRVVLWSRRLTLPVDITDVHTKIRGAWVRHQQRDVTARNLFHLFKRTERLMGLRFFLSQDPDIVFGNTSTENCPFKWWGASSGLAQNQSQNMNQNQSNQSTPATTMSTPSEAAYTSTTAPSSEATSAVSNSGPGNFKHFLEEILTQSNPGAGSTGAPNPKRFKRGLDSDASQGVITGQYDFADIEPIISTDMGSIDQADMNRLDLGSQFDGNPNDQWQSNPQIETLLYDLFAEINSDLA